MSKESIKINSIEYQSWHEVGHAVACIAKGGKVELIELVYDENSLGIAKASCHTTPDIRPYVTCGGFAAEYVLYKDGYLETVDDKEFTQIVFRNATHDRKMFLHKPIDYKGDFTKQEDTKFMHFAVHHVADIIRDNFSLMQDLVSELSSKQKLDKYKINEIVEKHNNANQPRIKLNGWLAALDNN